MSYYVYILHCADNTLYTGWTTDLDARFDAHSKGQGAKYTRGRGPLKLVYHETHPDKSTAMQREYAIKKLSRQEKLAIIKNHTGQVT